MLSVATADAQPPKTWTLWKTSLGTTTRAVGDMFESSPTTYAVTAVQRDLDRNACELLKETHMQNQGRRPRAAEPVPDGAITHAPRPGVPRGDGVESMMTRFSCLRAGEEPPADTRVTKRMPKTSKTLTIPRLPLLDKTKEAACVTTTEPDGAEITKCANR
jgi:hypothetical protein